MKKKSEFLNALVTIAVVISGALVCSRPAMALDLLPDIFKKEEVRTSIWELNEQYVRLVKIETGAPRNEHPVPIEAIELEQALASLQLWVGGGVFRDEQATPVYQSKQAALIARYVTDALSKASPDEDVTFNVRSYVDVLLALGREREWTTGRVFYVDGKLNLIIGEYQKRLDKAKKTVEGSFGVTDDFRDVYFELGSRKNKGKMPGRIVNTNGIEVVKDGKLRPDWVRIDVGKAALAYRDAQTPVGLRKEEKKAKAEAAKLTIERRQMREEMARMRKELKNLQGGSGGATTATVEERLSKLQQLLERGLISAEEFKQRKREILQDI